MIEHHHAPVAIVSEKFMVFAVQEEAAPVKNANPIKTNVQSVDGSSQSTLPKREKWGRDIEFLMSCIALSVGLGNVWRFPFTAYDNGGGAFVIPYIIVLIFIGKPVYYLEMLLGQFSSRGSIKVFDLSPLMRGIGYGQVMAASLVTTYYASLMALTIRYMILSCHDPLPWSMCRPEWNETCMNSGLFPGDNQTSPVHGNSTKVSSSAELFFLREVLHETDSIDNGIGTPDLPLLYCLITAWTIVALVLIGGIHTSGKASYFLAVFPYIIMFILLGRALTLPGAIDGVIYFFKPQWSEILKPKVWYAAVTQCFFSLAICFGNIIMYSSYNRFQHKIYRDATIVTTLDTMTSILAGTIIFGILGHLSHETGNDIKNVVRGGTGLAFITYPDALSKFQVCPQLFAVLFFVMLFILGIGSNIGMASVIITVIRDEFPKVKQWVLAVSVSAVGVAVGSIYCTPGGQYLINLLDFYGASFVALFLAVAELVTLGWIYGVNRLCKDIEFMLGRKTGWYWRICWGVITPVMMILILIYTIVDLKLITYRGYIYPDVAYVIAWFFFSFGVLQLPIWAIYAVCKQSGATLKEKILKCLKPHEEWGPSDLSLLKQYRTFLESKRN